MEFRLDPAVSHALHLELKAQARAVDNHLERKVEVVKLDSPRRREPGEQAPRDRVQVRRQRARMY